VEAGIGIGVVGRRLRKGRLGRRGRSCRLGW
jgi:hypothetical protein